LALPSEAVFDLDPRTSGFKRERGVVTPNEAADVLAVLYPALLRFAGNQLRSRQLDDQIAEDLVHEAVISWFAGGRQLRSSNEMYAWLRQAMVFRTAKLADPTRQRDVLDRNPLPLELLMAEPED